MANGGIETVDQPAFRQTPALRAGGVTKEAGSSAPRTQLAAGPAGFLESADQQSSETRRLPKAPARELPRMLSTAQVAEMFGRAPRTIRSWIDRGLLKPVKVGNSVFIPQAQIDALLSPVKRPQNGVQLLIKTIEKSGQ